MKIEKISDTQVKFILNQTDLSERNIKINELAYGSEKMQELFRDMLEQAMQECGFQPENNVPLMIEAIPLSAQSIMIIVTKVNNAEEFDSKLNLTPGSKDERKFAKRPIVDNTSTVTADDEMTIYSFNCLEDVTGASARLHEKYSGTNSLYKMNGRYYLIAHNDNQESDGRLTLADIEMILCEYGQKHTASVISKYYIAEHGNSIVKDRAVDVLSKL